MAGLPQGWEPREMAFNRIDHRFLSSSLAKMMHVVSDNLSCRPKMTLLPGEVRFIHALNICLLASDPQRSFRLLKSRLNVIVHRLPLPFD